MNLPTNTLGKLTAQKVAGCMFATYGFIRQINDTYIEFEDSDGEDKFIFKKKWIIEFEPVKPNQ